MSLATSLTILLLIILCILPFVIISRNRKKAERKFLQDLLDYAATRNVEILQHEMLINQIIGISDKENILFFVKKRDNQNIVQEVNLNEIERCYVNKPTRNSIDGNYSAAERIELCFTNRDKSKPETKFELYNLEHDSLSLTGELQLAENWQTLVSNKISEKKRKP